MSQRDQTLSNGTGYATSNAPRYPATRIVFLDHLRVLMIILVVLHHAVAAYANVAPHWIVRDGSSHVADCVRELLDLFMMPVLFFAAGYFAWPSLSKRGLPKFLGEKAQQLLIPWILAVLVLIPLGLYGQANHGVKPFWRYWLWYSGSFETRLRFTQMPVGPTTQAVYWFISLLFVFFVLFTLIATLVRRWARARDWFTRQTADTGSTVASALILFGGLTFVAYFISILLFPDSSWFTLSALLEFQVTRLSVYAGYFALGLYAQWRGWLTTGKPLGSPVLWGAASAALVIAYLLVGQPFFADTAGNAHPSVGLLLSFAFVRSFALLAVFVLIISTSALYWNRSHAVEQQLGETSYNIYLTHYWAVVGMQSALLAWAGGPTLVKMATVFVVALGLSFAFSKWVLGRWPRAFALALLGLFIFCLAVRP
jgi:glucans biosynthesis protein C